MMEMEAITTLVTTVGFPIAMCLMMMKQNDAYRNEITDLVKNNTEAITKLCEKIDSLLNRD
jgi:hypothetical protein